MDIYQQHMWFAFEDELTKTAAFDGLSEMEKQAILRHLKRGYKAVAKKADDLYWKAGDAYLRGLKVDPLLAAKATAKKVDDLGWAAGDAYLRGGAKLGLDPLAIQDLAEGAMHAGLHGGAGAAVKNLGVGAAVTATKKTIPKLRYLTSGLGNFFGEKKGVGALVGGNTAANYGSYASRPSYEGLFDAVSSIV
jgi:hypothetical protein